MSWAADILKTGIKIADGLTKSGGLQPFVTHQAWIGQSGAGDDLFVAIPVRHQAVVDRSSKQLFTKSGKILTVVATVMFLEPVPATTPNSGQQRRNPIDPRDIITLDDGFTGPIVHPGGGVENADDSSPFLNEVMIGVV